MAKLKTTKGGESVDDFIESIEDQSRREACLKLLAVMKEVTGKSPAIWGKSMIGFGSYHYKYESGHEGDWFVTGFANRKNDLTVYFLSGFTGLEALMERLGQHKTGRSCLYIRSLEDIDLAILKEMVEKSVQRMQGLYDCR